MLHLSLDFHDVYHRISSSRQHNDNGSVVHRVLNDFLHIERRWDDIVLTHLFLLGNEFLEHKHYLVRSEETHDDRLVKDTQFVPFARPDEVVRLGVRALIKAFPEADVFLHVFVKVFKYFKLLRHLHDAGPGFVGQPSALSCRVRSV